MGFTLTASSSAAGGANLELPPSGAQPARCVAIIDLGTRMESFANEPAKEVRKVLIAWELTNAPDMSGTKGRKHVIALDYRASLNEKSNLRKHLRAWRNGKDIANGEDFDLEVLLGKPCLLTISHEQAKNSERVYARVTNVSSVPEGLKVLAARHTPFMWTIDSGEPYPDPDWVPYLYGRPVGEVIAESMEIRRAVPTPVGANPAPPAPLTGKGLDDETPF